MAKDSPSQIMPKVQVRMDEAFRQKLMEAAFKADRSLNAEIMARLERSFEHEGAAPDGFDVRQEVKRHHSWMVVMMEALAKSDDKAFDPVRNVLNGMDKAGKDAAVQWFRENEDLDSGTMS